MCVAIVGEPVSLPLKAMSILPRGLLNLSRGAYHSKCVCTCTWMASISCIRKVSTYILSEPADRVSRETSESKSLGQPILGRAGGCNPSECARSLGLDHPPLLEYR